MRQLRTSHVVDYQTSRTLSLDATGLSRSLVRHLVVHSPPRNASRSVDCILQLADLQVAVGSSLSSGWREVTHEARHVRRRVQQAVGGGAIRVLPAVSVCVHPRA